MKFPSSTRSALLAGLTWAATLSSPTPALAQTFAKGADVGWLQQMEATGYVFRNNQGQPQDCFRILKDKGINAIRLRVFVNPSDDKASGHCSPAEVTTMAKRAAKMGFRLMIDFHYSDSWADPAKQNKPAAWATHSFEQLQQDVYEHTRATMQLLKDNGITPEWVQVGNEIPNGMLWPDGRSTDNFKQLSQLLNKGYDAVKAVSPKSKVVVHLDRGNNSKLYRWFFDQHQANGGRYDVIGMSYYPFWLKQNYKLTIDSLRLNLNDMAQRYRKEVVVAEVGGVDTEVQDTYDLLQATQAAVRAVPGGKGLGVFYWEPEGARSWSHYELSAWGDDGRPTRAMDAFKTPPATRPTPVRPRPAKAKH